jgi:hypothetical protein
VIDERELYLCCNFPLATSHRCAILSHTILIQFLFFLPEAAA